MDLMQHECMCFNDGTPQQFWTFTEQGQEMRVPVEGQFKSNNAGVLHAVVLAGCGVALLPDWLVNDDIDGGRLTSEFDAFVVNPNSASPVISALDLPSQRGSKRINAFIDFLSELLKSQSQSKP